MPRRPLRHYSRINAYPADDQATAAIRFAGSRGPNAGITVFLSKADGEALLSTLLRWLRPHREYRWAPGIDDTKVHPFISQWLVEPQTPIG